MMAALFRGATLTLENSRYLDAVSRLTGELLRTDLEQADLTTEALGLENSTADLSIIAAESGVVAGLEEAAWLYARSGLTVERLKSDGQRVLPDEAVLRIQGSSKDMLHLERVCLNLIQRMSGIATAAHRLQDLLHSRAPEIFVVATRKTPWGLLDKRAVHLGGGGTHRLGLWDAILIKNNHLKFFGNDEAGGVSLALKRAWPHRQNAAFIEVEVTALARALAAARTFRELQQSDPEACPCILMLDNVNPGEAARIVAALQAQDLRDHLLIEVSGKISEAALEAYAASAVDAISVGALTHSCRALDFRARMKPGSDSPR
jgi:nicotinate-nucleotide pyrophosphorylase (carboxylating)